MDDGEGEGEGIDGWIEEGGKDAGKDVGKDVGKACGGSGKEEFWIIEESAKFSFGFLLYKNQRVIPPIIIIPIRDFIKMVILFKWHFN